MTSKLRCIGRVDALGDPDEKGEHIGFRYSAGYARHTIVLKCDEAQALSLAIGRAIWPELIG